jgi:phosphomannomutase
MHKIDLSIVREYDIRGIYGKKLFPEDAEIIGKALGTKALINGSNVINLGYDGRLSSPILKEKMIAGIISTGCNVNNLGLVPSPVLYFSNYELNIDYGIVITASHNPKEYNGFKIHSKKERFYGKDLIEFARFANSHNFKIGQGVINEIDIIPSYFKKLTRELQGIATTNLKIAWDPACGAAAALISDLTKLIPAKHFLINAEIDGNFPAHEPDPTIEKNLTQLQEIVRKNNCDLGIAFDGDADRIGVVDNEGEVLWGDQLVTVYAKDILKTAKNAKIIADVKASNIFQKKIHEYGGVPIIWKTGHSLIKAKMQEENALLAGEMSGHIFFNDQDNHGYDDGIYAAIRLVKIIINNNFIISDYRKSLPVTYSTKEEKIACLDEKKFIIIEKIKEHLKSNNIKFSDIDGVRVENDNGWWLIRASNTSPNLTTRCEAETPEHLNNLKENIRKLISKFI